MTLYKGEYRNTVCTPHPPACGASRPAWHWLGLATRPPSPLLQPARPPPRRGHMDPSRGNNCFIWVSKQIHWITRWFNFFCLFSSFLDFFLLFSFFSFFLYSSEWDTPQLSHRLSASTHALEDSWTRSYDCTSAHKKIYPVILHPLIEDRIAHFSYPWQEKANSETESWVIFLTFPLVFIGSSIPF